MDLILTTFIKRPYVLAFLISYIFIAVRVVGLRWTLIYLICGYAIAFFSEYTSINYGFPYGWYFYKYEHLQGEWLNHGVPVWDSLSYVFMSFAGLYAAKFSMRRGAIHCARKHGDSHQVGFDKSNPYVLVILSAIFVTILDIIIDPIAHMGHRWFLGDIYYYPNPGYYFNITLANFVGWFLVSFLINTIGVFVLGFDKKCKITPINNFLTFGLYYGIFAFGLVIAIYLKEWLLVLCDLFWFMLTIGLLKNPFLSKTSQISLKGNS